MGRILRCVVAALAAAFITSACEAWAQADANLQSLFVGLTQGTEVTLVTPLANGMAEVTSFSPPGRFSAADAAGALERARQQLATQQLALHGIVNPTAEQIRIAMFGGTLTPPSAAAPPPSFPPGEDPSCPHAKGHRMKPLFAVIALAAFNAHAQAPAPTPAPTPVQAPAAQAPAVPLPLQVERLAPQLVAFAGSQANFDSLVNGLAAGVPVTLTTVGDGVTQTVTFTPPGGAVSTPVEIARVLETARQQLISAGVASPNAQQIATILAGTAVPATIGTTTPPGAAARSRACSGSQLPRSGSSAGTVLTTSHSP